MDVSGNKTQAERKWPHKKNIGNLFICQPATGNRLTITSHFSD